MVAMAPSEKSWLNSQQPVKATPHFEEKQSVVPEIWKILKGLKAAFNLL